MNRLRLERKDSAGRRPAPEAPAPSAGSQPSAATVALGLQRSVGNAAAAAVLQGHAKAPRRQLARVTHVEMDQDEQVASDDEVIRFDHQRAAVHPAARAAALNQGIWAAVPPGATANHSISYDRIARALNDQVAFEELEEGLVTLTGMYHAVAAPGGVDANAMATVNQFGQGVPVNVDRDNLNSSLNYLIYKICDMPSNLFFWPAAQRTGGDPDLPQPIAAPPAGWVPKPGADLTGATELARLNASANYLRQTVDP